MPWMIEIPALTDTLAKIQESPALSRHSDDPAWTKDTTELLDPGIGGGFR